MNRALLKKLIGLALIAAQRAGGVWTAGRVRRQTAADQGRVLRASGAAGSGRALLGLPRSQEARSGIAARLARRLLVRGSDTGPVVDLQNPAAAGC